jgi:hypothetical protein
MTHIHTPTLHSLSVLVRHSTISPLTNLLNEFKRKLKYLCYGTLLEQRHIRKEYPAINGRNSPLYGTEFSLKICSQPIKTRPAFAGHKSSLPEIIFFSFVNSSAPLRHTRFPRSILILPRIQALPRDILPLGLPINIMYGFIFPTMRNRHTTNFALLHFVTRRIWSLHPRTLQIIKLLSMSLFLPSQRGTESHTRIKENIEL